MNGDKRSHFIISPFCLLTLVFIAGIAAEHSASLSLPPALLLSLASFLFLLLIHGFHRSSPFRRPAIPLALFFGLGMLASRLAAPDLPSPPDLSPFFDRPQTLYLAEISGPADFYPDKVRIPLRLRKAFLDGETVTLSAGVLLSIRDCKKLWLQGDLLLIRLTIEHFHNFNNPGGYDYVRTQAQRGFYARAHVQDDRLIIKISENRGTSAFSISNALLQRTDLFRQEALAWLKVNLAPDPAAFYASLLIGYQHQLSTSWQDHLSRVGVSHLLSISGLHLGLVSLAAFWLTRHFVRIFLTRLLRSTSDQHIALCVAFAVATLYALVSGLALPTWRSAFMLLFSLGAFYWYRSPDPLSALGAAALAILVIAPCSLWEISFQLSFAAMLGMFVLYPRLRRFELLSQHSHFLLRMLKPFEEAFWVSISANLLVLPLIVYYFHGISVAGFAANVVLVPLTGFTVLPLGLLALVLFLFSETLALPVLLAGGWFLGLCEKLILWFSHLSWAYFWVGVIDVYHIIALYSVAAFLLGSWTWQRKAVSTLAMAVTVLAISMSVSGAPQASSTQGLQVTAVDVGQGSCTLVRFPSGEIMLVDGGGFFDESFDIGRNVLAPLLWHFGIRKLDYVMLSHDHPDHRNGLRFILEHFKIQEFWETGISDNPDSCSLLAKIASARGIPLRQLPEIFGEHLIGGCRVHILHPSPQYINEVWAGKELNEVSLLLQIDFGGTHLIIPGDIGASIEQSIFSGSELAGSVILIVPHHGSAYSSSPHLLDRIHPDAAILSVGYGNQLGLPAPSTLKRYRERNIPIYRTDRHGAIQAFSDGKTWTINTAMIE